MPALRHAAAGGPPVSDPTAPVRLDDTIAVVAGATRGAGRGIAVALGEAGATVICTGRSSRTKSLTSDYLGRPETIEETAELVDEAGGVGIPVVVDYLDAAQVGALTERIRDEFGRLDVCVNNVWGGETLKGGPDIWNRPIWDCDLDDGLRLLRLGVETHLIAAHHLLPLLITNPGGLLVEVTDGTRAYNADHYRISAFYDLAKASVNRLAFAFGHELAAHDAIALAVTPGWLRSEMMLEAFGTTEHDWRTANAPPGFAASESPRFVGRAIAAVAADPARSRWNQHSVTAGELARHYDIVDIDGSQPDAWRYITDSEHDPTVDANDYR